MARPPNWRRQEFRLNAAGVAKQAAEPDGRGFAAIR
jgi:hypothetical protein